MVTPSGFEVTVRSGPTKMAVIECVRTDTGVKFVSVRPNLGPAPIVGDIIGKLFEDVATLRAAIRRRWSKDGFKLYSRIVLMDNVKQELGGMVSAPLAAQVKDDELTIVVDDGNCVIQKQIPKQYWRWVAPVDAGLCYEEN